MKTCQICREALPLSAFGRDVWRRDGLESRCKPCAVKKSLVYNRKHPEKHSAGQRKYYSRNQRKAKDGWLKKYYGLTLDEYNAMLLGQNSRCAICGGVNKDGKALHVDHDHVTGKIRDLLCNLCNSMLGYGRESRELFEKAVFYLEKHSK